MSARISCVDIRGAPGKISRYGVHSSFRMTEEDAIEVPLAAVPARNGARTLHFSLAAHLASACNRRVISQQRQRFTPAPASGHRDWHGEASYSTDDRDTGGRLTLQLTSQQAAFGPLSPSLGEESRLPSSKGPQRSGVT